MGDPAKGSNQIFICYRRKDSAAIAGRIYDRLIQKFGRESVFIDVDSTPLGINFRQFIDSIIAGCAVVLVVIGDRWFGLTNEPGKNRFDNPRDHVRIEIESALKRDIPVIPLMVDDVTMPPEEALPQSISEIVYRNGMIIRHNPYFDSDVKKLIGELDKLVSGTSLKVPLPQSAPSTPPSRREKTPERQEESGGSSDFDFGAMLDQYEKEQTLNNLEEGIIVEGQIKNLTDYGAFVDLGGGVDGLLHLADMSRGRLRNPAEMFRVGENVQVKVLKFDKERERVSLGYKQLLPDPWESVEERYRVGQLVNGEVVEVTGYRVLVELESGVEGRVDEHRDLLRQRTSYREGDYVEAEILSIDMKHRNISLGIRRIEAPPRW